jgi:hypothetical protein
MMDMVTQLDLSHPATGGQEIYQAALEAFAHGINVVPIAADGTKRPPFRWQPYQRERVRREDLARWFLRLPGAGLGFLTGQISGHLEALDFDTPEVYTAWRAAMHHRALDRLAARLVYGYREATPGGVHLLYRSPAVGRNQRLAGRLIAPERLQSLIDTRGEGGLIVVAPSQGKVHPSGQPYVLLEGSVATIPTLSAAERECVLTVARSLDEIPASRKPEVTERRAERSWAAGQKRRPGDLYNARTCWVDLLGAHGWIWVKRVGEEDYWRRPGKSEGVSATTNYGGSDLLYVFSTSTCFPTERGIDKFGAYTLLEHGGDLAAATRALVALGYVDQDTQEAP